MVMAEATGPTILYLLLAFARKHAQDTQIWL